MILLSDGFLANGTEPWLLPDPADLPDISVPFTTEFNHTAADGTPEFWPYLRDPDTLARPWAIPGTPGLMHRVGGIEKEDGSGNINYSPANHEKMVHLRAAKVARIADDLPPLEVHGDRRRRHLHCSDGDPRGPRSTPPCNEHDDEATRWRGCTSSTSTRCHATSATCCGGSAG